MTKKYVIFWLVVMALISGIFLVQKVRNDLKGLQIWQETNNKLDKIIEFLQK